MSETNDLHPLAIDGSSNNDNKQQVMLNMCYFDINDLNEGTENRNREVRYIKSNVEYFKNVILIGDNNIKFIIRSKGNADNLNNPKLKKSTHLYDTIKNCQM